MVKKGYFDNWSVSPRTQYAWYMVEKCGCAFTGGRLVFSIERNRDTDVSAVINKWFNGVEIYSVFAQNMHRTHPLSWLETLLSGDS